MAAIDSYKQLSLKIFKIKPSIRSIKDKDNKKDNNNKDNIKDNNKDNINKDDDKHDIKDNTYKFI